MISTVLFYVFVVMAVIQLCYLLTFTSFLFHKTSNKSLNKNLPISVIVYAKNEVYHLNKLIPILQQQEYETYELVLINDASNDETLEKMKEYEAKDPRIKVVNVKNNEAFWGNKKYALTLGIKSAKYEQLLFTDADSVPTSKQWIKEMSLLFSDSKSIILGYVKYESKKYSFFNTLIRYEKLLSTLQYFSFAILKSPYMADGKNLAYKKSEFFKVNGFINHIKINSGHDNLFIKDASTSTNTTIVFDPKSHIICEGPKTLKKWSNQKQNHTKTTSQYKLKHKLLLSVFNSSKFLFLLLIPLMLLFKSILYTSAIVLIYFTLNYLVIGYSAKKLKETRLIYFLPFLELFLVLFQFAIFMTNSISKPKTHWK